MSLAEKLYRIGECIDDSEFAENLETKIEKIDDNNFIALELYVSLKFENRFEWEMKQVDKIDKKQIYLTKRIGGSGSGTIYLYPNVINEDKQKGIDQLLTSIEKSVLIRANKHKRVLTKISERLKNDKDKLIASIADKPTNKNTIFFALINKQTFYEKYPEVLSSYVGMPASKPLELTKTLEAQIKQKKKIQDKILKEQEEKSTPKTIRKLSSLNSLIKELNLEERLVSASFFQNGQAELGYKAEVNFFNFFNYINSDMELDIVEKLPLSKLDAATINKGWLFCDKQKFLKKEHEKLKYYILPNSKDKELMKKLIKKLKTSKTLSQIADSTSKNFIEELKDFSNWIIGDEQGNLVTFDIIFYEDNNNQREIFGTIQDVAPSQISEAWKLMYDFEDFSISDNFHRVYDKKEETIYLMDYFCKNALWAKLNNSERDSKQKYKRFLANERIFLASLLLGRQKVSMDELLRIINKNINYGLKRQDNSFVECKTLTDEGVKRLLVFPKGLTLKHRVLIKFLRKINAIKE